MPIFDINSSLHKYNSNKWENSDNDSDHDNDNTNLIHLDSNQSNSYDNSFGLIWYDIW